ncbi:MAG: lipoyl(octanoyl) transferase LipB [Thermoleophilia bacterium]
MEPTPAVLLHTTSMAYDTALDAQHRLADLRRAGRIPDVVWLLEHPPVFTTGRHGARGDLFVSDDHLAALGASFHTVDRGGHMTWHGPGQTTGYVIADLRPGRRVRAFVEALVQSMAQAGLRAGLPDVIADQQRMGLYHDGRKLGSVGIRVSGGVTLHGLALNRDPDMSWFELMTACAAPDVRATSIAAEGGDPTRATVEASLAEALATRMALRLEPGSLDDLLGA